MIQQPRVRTKTYGDKRFDKTASTFWNNLPSETRNPFVIIQTIKYA
jgi:hypothetical protein